MTTTIVGLQRRLRELGRIRIGEKVATSNGRERPAKLNSFRLTSRNPDVIHAASERWGGDVKPWTSPDGQQWEVVTNTADLRCVLPPTEMGFSQAYELWSAGGCQRRCDGQLESLSDSECKCDPEKRECNLHTRLSVMLPDLPGLGLWRLDTSGYYAASELAGTIDLVRAAGITGLLPARLRLEQRSVKRPDPRDPSKVTTMRFAVPVIDLMSLDALMAAAVPVGELGAERPQLLAGVPNFTPIAVAELPEAPFPSVSDQIAAVNTPKARKGSQVPIPSTGLEPGGAPALVADEPAQDEPSGPYADAEAHAMLGLEIEQLDVSERALLKEWWPNEWAPASLKTSTLTDQMVADVTAKVYDLLALRQNGHDPASTDDIIDAEVVDDPPERRSETNARSVAILAGRVFKRAYDEAPRGDKTKVVDRLRYALTFGTTDGPVHTSDLTVEQIIRLDTLLRSIESGDTTWQHDDTGVTFTRPTGAVVRVDWAMFENNETVEVVA